MSMPNIPDITPNITLDIEDSIKVLINSISLQEIGFSHIINAEGEKIQCILKMIEECNISNPCVASREILKVNESVNNTIKSITKSQMVLQFKLEEAKELYEKIRQDRSNCGFDNVNRPCSEVEEKIDEMTDLANSILKKNNAYTEGIDCRPICF